MTANLHLAPSLLAICVEGLINDMLLTLWNIVSCHVHKTFRPPRPTVQRSARPTLDGLVTSEECRKHQKEFNPNRVQDGCFAQICQPERTIMIGRSFPETFVCLKSGYFVSYQGTYATFHSYPLPVPTILPRLHTQHQ